MRPFGLAKAEYVFRPRQLLRRLLLEVRRPRGPTSTSLPWGDRIVVNAGDTVGRAILALGVYELPLTEALWRLTEPGEAAADVGANIGQMTAALGARVGVRGVVCAIEAHPEIFDELRRNVERWGGPSKFRLVQAAVSRAPGTVLLETPVGFSGNRGLARVITASASATGTAPLQVQAVTLDDMFRNDRPPVVVKLDVEGHELAALEGARQLLASRSIRDCVFEEHRAYPSDVTDLLEGHGFEVFLLRRALSRVELLPAWTPRRTDIWEPCSFLATLDPDRARERLRGRGWRCLREPVA